MQTHIIVSTDPKCWASEVMPYLGRYGLARKWMDKERTDEGYMLSLPLREGAIYEVKDHRRYYCRVKGGAIVSASHLDANLKIRIYEDAYHAQ